MEINGGTATSEKTYTRSSSNIFFLKSETFPQPISKFGPSGGIPKGSEMQDRRSGVMEIWTQSHFELFDGAMLHEGGSP
jgi:hypothetical protein